MAGSPENEVMSESSGLKHIRNGEANILIFIGGRRAACTTKVLSFCRRRNARGTGGSPVRSCHVLIFDAHLDLAWNALDWNRDLALPVAEIRRQEQARGQTAKGQGCNTVSFPALRDGKVGIFIATLLARLFRSTAIPAVERYSSMQAAYAAAQGQLNYYKLLEEQGFLRWIKDRSGLQSHACAWMASDKAEEPLGFILSMEGADPILSPRQVAE